MWNWWETQPAIISIQVPLPPWRIFYLNRHFVEKRRLRRPFVATQFVLSIIFDAIGTENWIMYSDCYGFSSDKSSCGCVAILKYVTWWHLILLLLNYSNVRGTDEKNNLDDTAEHWWRYVKLQMTYDEWWMINDVWCMKKDKRQMMNRTWRMVNEKRYLSNDEWYKKNEKIWMMNDEWRRMSEEWRIRNDEWKMRNVKWWMVNNEEWWSMHDEWWMTTVKWGMMNDEWL